MGQWECADVLYFNYWKAQRENLENRKRKNGQISYTHTHTQKKKGQNYNTPSHQKLRKPVENGVTTKKILK